MQPSDPRRARRRRSFTLIEIMIVIVIIGMIVGLVGPSLMQRLGRAKRETAKTQISLLKNACLDYYLDMQEFPGSLDDLITKSGDPKWDGPYLDPPKIPVDPWGQPYQYEAPAAGEKGVHIWSSGEDKVSGGNDDINLEK